MSKERELIDAVVYSTTAEIPGARNWTIKRHRPIWRNPVEGQVLYVYCPTRVPTGIEGLGMLDRRIDMIVEYVEPADAEMAAMLQRDEDAELDAYDIVEDFDEWAQNHRQGFPPAREMALASITSGSGQSRPEAFVRYCTVALQFIV